MILKSGKWYAVHVPIEWEIYWNQKKSSDKPNVDSKELLRPPSHLHPVSTLSRAPDLQGGAASSLLGGPPGRPLLESSPNSHLSSSFPRPSPYAISSSSSSLNSNLGLGTVGLPSSSRDLGAGLGNPVRPRIHRTTPIYPRGMWGCPDEREKELEREREIALERRREEENRSVRKIEAL
ncbi:autism susceptibility gene 2 protein-like [Dreissena polymorpha]|uniref:autism susceptibility gene 2 protein-like n=1 Tax=Dreissena polymorpha TaxID=45954 RepID=UPI0022648D84|nr:autism susceptibility gene 2 protein-like [Dreissena polymorpha]